MVVALDSPPIGVTSLVVSIVYRVYFSGKFQGGLIFVGEPSASITDVCDHANTCMYKRAYFVGLNSVVSPGSMTTASINTFENFPQYLCTWKGKPHF